MNKRCSSCAKEKALADFSRDKKSKSGFSYKCKQCASEATRRLRESPEFRQKQIAWNNKWRDKNKEKVLEIRRRSQKKIYETLKAVGFVTQEIRNRILVRDGGKCLSCGGGEDLTIDHIEPISLGGITTDENLQVLCRSCNARKHKLSTCYRMLYR